MQPDIRLLILPLPDFALLPFGAFLDKLRFGLADMLVDETRDSRHALRSLELGGGPGRQAERAQALMRHHLGTPVAVEQLAAQLGISRRQLDRQFQASHGVSAKAWWLEMRLQQARWRLCNSSHSLMQIADEVGFADASHLGKCVRRRFGCTALALRQAYCGEPNNPVQ